MPFFILCGYFKLPKFVVLLGAAHWMKQPTLASPQRWGSKGRTQGAPRQPAVLIAPRPLPAPHASSGWPRGAHPHQFAPTGRGPAWGQCRGAENTWGAFTNRRGWGTPIPSAYVWTCRRCGDPWTEGQMKPRRVWERRNRNTRRSSPFPPQRCHCSWSSIACLPSWPVGRRYLPYSHFIQSANDPQDPYPTPWILRISAE